MFWVSETQVKCVGKRIFEAGLFINCRQLCLCQFQRNHKQLKLNYRWPLEIFINPFFSFYMENGKYQENGCLG